MPSSRIQNQVPGELLCVEGEPRVCEYQSNLWLLRRMYVALFSRMWLNAGIPIGDPLLPRHTGKRRYNIKLWKTFTDCFNCLPIAAIIDEKIFTMHGGLSPDLQSMEQIRRVMRPTDVPDTGMFIFICLMQTDSRPPAAHGRCEY